MMQKSPDEVEEIAKFYDYLEVQPIENYAHLIENELVKDEQALQEIIENIVQLGEKLKLPVVATGNVHYLNIHHGFACMANTRNHITLFNAEYHFFMEI